MPEDKIVLGEPDTGKPAEDAAPSGPPEGGQPSGGEPSFNLDKFKNSDGTIDYTRLQDAYGNIEKEKGRLANEVGDLRKAATDYTDFFKNEYVETAPNQWVHKSQANARHEPPAAPRTETPPAGPTREELNERIRDALATDPASVVEMIFTTASRNALQEQARREKALSSPFAQKDASIKSEAIEYMNKGYGEEEAIAIAVGRKAMAMAGGGQPSGPSNWTLPSSMNVTRTFIQPNGKPPNSEPKKPELSAEQIAMAVKLGRNPENVARYLETKS